MRNLLAAAAVVALLSASASARSWTRLAGQHSGIVVTRAVVVRSEMQWKSLWREHDPSSPAPKVDFSRVQVVAVFAGRTETAGVRVKIVVQKDPLDSSRLDVFYREVVSRGGFAAQVRCAPYAIVKLPASAVVDLERDAAVRVPEWTAGVRVRNGERRMRALMGGLSASFGAN